EPQLHAVFDIFKGLGGDCALQGILVGHGGYYPFFCKGVGRDARSAAMNQAAAVMIQETRKAVHGMRVVGAARIAGTQTMRVKALNIAACSMAAQPEKIESIRPTAQTSWATPVRKANTSGSGNQWGMKPAVSRR